MSALAWPTDLPPVSEEWALQAPTQAFRSPFTGSVQVRELAGARWMVTLAFNQDDPDVLAPLQALLVRLRGQAGTFALHSHHRPVPRGVATGTPLVDGASQTGASLDTKGWTAGQSGILLAGDYIGVNGELKMVVADADADGAGLATLLIEPPLRASPADEAVITTVRPTATFRLADDGQARWRTVGARPEPLTSLTVTAEEVIA